MNINGGNSMDTNSHDLGSGDNYGTGDSYGTDGSRPPSAAWLFTVLTWRI